ncbi:unnamed protein product, partial [Ixodes pacificus]
GAPLQVLSGDTVVIRGQPRGGPPPVRTLYLSNITAPKLAKRPTETISETKDEPFAWEAREFLRKKLVGKEVIFFVEYSASNRDYGTVYLGKDRSGENVAESLVSEGLVDVRQGGKGESYQRLCDLHEVARSAGRGKHGPDASSHVRDVKWTLRDNEDPRTFVDRHGRKPIPAVVEHVRDGSTVRVMLLPDFHYITLMLSGIRCPSTRPDESSSGAESPLVEEAKYFTESRLLQRDVEVVLEGATNQNFTGSVLHPNGNIAEGLLKNGFAKCIDWSLTTVTGGSEKLKAAEKEAKEKRLRLWKDYSAPTAGLGADAKFEGKVVEVINADALVVRLEDGELRKIFLSSIRPPRRSEEAKATSGESGGKERNFRPLYDIPFMYEAREFLRKKLIGKSVQVGVDYKQPASNSFPEKTCCTVTIGGINVAEALVSKGLATVVRYRQDDDQRSAHYNELLAAEMKAQKSSRGLHSKKDASGHRVVDLSGDPAKSKQFLPFLQRAGKMEAVVEFVASGSRLRLYIPRENCLATFLLAGISCPKASRLQGGQQVEGEPFGNEALAYTKGLCLQREVRAPFSLNCSCTSSFHFIFIILRALSGEICTLTQKQPIKGMLNRNSELMKQGWSDRRDAAKPKNITHTVISRMDDRIYGKEVKNNILFCRRIGEREHGAPSLRSLRKRYFFFSSGRSTQPPGIKKKASLLCKLAFPQCGRWRWGKASLQSKMALLTTVLSPLAQRDKTDASRLAPLPSLGIRDLPPMAREYSLALVALPKDPEQAQEARQAMVQLTAEAALQLNVEYRVGGQEFVTLLVKEGGLDVGKSLLQEGWVLLEERRDRHLQDLVREYAQAQDSAKAKRLNLWCYGDVTEDDSKEFGWGR